MLSLSIERVLVGDCKAEAERTFLPFYSAWFFSTVTSRMACEGPSTVHLANSGLFSSVAGLPAAEITYHHRVAAPVIHQSSLWQWAACLEAAMSSLSLSRGMKLSLVGTSLKFLTSSVVHSPSALGKQFSAVFTSALFTVFFYPFHLVNSLTILYLKISLFKLLLTEFWLTESPKKTK